jgi:hypothetical protein
MSWVAIIAAIFKAIGAVSDYLLKQQALDAASAEIFSRYAKGALNEINAANEARAAVKHDLVHHPERLRDTDGFRRD